VLFQQILGSMDLIPSLETMIMKKTDTR